VNPEQKTSVQDAHTALAKTPRYCGAVIVLFTNDYRDAQVSKHAVREDLADNALASVLMQREMARPSIVVPSDHRNREQRRHDGSG
jgi:hypothetical protein